LGIPDWAHYTQAPAGPAILISFRNMGDTENGGL
jgi:hypothetical protein